MHVPSEHMTGVVVGHALVEEEGLMVIEVSAQSAAASMHVPSEHMIGVVAGHSYVAGEGLGVLAQSPPSHWHASVLQDASHCPLPTQLSNGHPLLKQVITLASTAWQTVPGYITG